MGVATGAGSMSTTTDVIYTHKKFKRAAVEAWESQEVKNNLIEKNVLSSLSEATASDSKSSKVESYGSISEDNNVICKETEPIKNEKKFSCLLCGFVNGNKSIFQQHSCVNAKDKKPVFCKFCKQNFKLYSSHNCISSKESHSGKSNNSDKEINKDFKLSSDSLKISYNRSHSYPLTSSIYNNEDAISLASSEGVTHETLPINVAKQIYKPKFRAQYSFTQEAGRESTSHNQITKSELLCANRNSQEKISFASTIPSTYHVHTHTASSLFNASLQSDARPLSPHPGRHHISPLDVQNTKIEEFQGFHKVGTTPCSSLWKGIKGIKSPSPELVNQHITNLIVQNQAIVETHNPLWSMKYRRQSSTSSLVENENSSSKSRRTIVSDYSKTSKVKTNSILNLNQNLLADNLTESSQSSPLSSLPKPYHSSSASSRASKLNISAPLPTSSIVSKVKNVDTYSCNFNVQCSDNITVNSNLDSSNVVQSESLDLSRYTTSNIKNYTLLSCPKCGLVVPSIEAKEHICKLPGNHSSHFNYDSKSVYEHGKLKDNTNYRIIDQEAALDLHKKSEKNFLEYERSSSRESCLSEPIYKDEDDSKMVRCLSISPNLQRQDSCLLTSPPLKRRKFSSNTVSTKEKLLYPPLFSNNGKIASKGDYGIQMLEDLNKPKSNSNHIFGGEVKICDGNEYKTLKIDSIKNETPSLDMCLASKRLTGELQDKEQLLPTSVVVTIAKCGLNSGGTMVKVENKSYSNKSRSLSITESSSTNLSNKPPIHSEILADHNFFSSVGLSVSPVIHPSLMQYSQSQSHITGKCPTISTSSLPQGGYSLHLLPSGLTLHPQSKVGSSLSLATSTSQSNSRELLPSLKIKASSNQTNFSPYPTIISIGEERVPYVPGIPGPYSQSGMVIKCPTKSVVAGHVSSSIWNPSIKPLKGHSEQAVLTVSSIVSQGNSPKIFSLPTKVGGSESLSILPVTKKPSEKIVSSLGCGKESVVKSATNVVCSKETFTKPEVLVPQTLEINAQPLLIKSKYEIEEKSKNNTDLKQPVIDDSTFLIPRQRPSTLLIKQQSFNAKSNLALIGSTLVSPETPRPRKSCAQLLLNGSAYTYLNLKVSTKTFFCCIYRPQPMYVSQSTNPKLSMYSNWQIRKTEDPLNLSPADAMSLHISGHYYNKAYTIAKPKNVHLIITPSTYWTQKKKQHNKEEIKSVVNEKTNQLSETKNVIGRNDLLQMANADADEESEVKVAKRVKIFEGGFKTNEDYIYVRGRGRGRYVCETCGIRCKKPSMLKKHIRTHTDLRPFACKHCSFSFKTKGNLTKHLKSKAHFKRCTEMGISPVPVTVDDSHINQEALQLQGILEAEQGKDTTQSNEDGDEDDDDDGEDDDDDDCDEEDDDDDEEEDYTNSSSQFCSYSSGVDLGTYSSCISSVKCSNLTPTSLYVEEGASQKTVELEIKEEPIFESGDENGPMDLSVKRASVITSSDYQSSGEENLKTNYPSLNKRLIGGSMKHSSTSSSHLIQKLPFSTNPIKEQASEILSPVTESSMLLKSIYNTTSSLDKQHLNADIIKDRASCGNMLHTYLKECAVLDSARKRYQYLNTASSEYLSYASSLNMQPLPNCSLPEMFTNSNLNSQSKLSVSNMDTCSSMPINVSANSTVVVSTTNVTSTTSIFVTGFGHNKYETTITAIPSTSTVRSIPDQICVSTVPENINIISPKSKSGTSAIKKSSLISSISQSSPSSTSSTYIVANKIPVTSNFSSLRNSSAKITRSSCNNLSGSLHSGVRNSMPTPPANLTVVNTCEGDSKPAFIAPSGVLPSNSARMGSDDGKCKCSICHKEFAKQAQLRLHMNIHFIERPHRCDACGVSFRTNGHLQKHKRSVSHFNKVNMNMTFGTPSTDNPRPFKCHDCKIAFRIHGHLAKHLRSKLHIMKLECLGKLPFGTYAEIERSGVNLNEIDTSDCENSLESLQAMASRLYEKDPAKLVAWQSQQLQQSQQIKAKEARQNRGRTVSNSSTNSEDYLLDEQDGAMTSKSNEEDSGEDEEMGEISVGTPTSQLLSPSSSGGRENQSSPAPCSSLPPCEVGSGATEGLLGCPQCHQKFLDAKHFEIHYYNEHEKLNPHEN